MGIRFKSLEDPNHEVEICRALVLNEALDNKGSVVSRLDLPKFCQQLKVKKEDHIL
jgi:hypothetical protein